VSLHTCHWPGCPQVVPPKLWGCKTHWFRLPAHLRQRILDAYVPGQELTKTPSAVYLQAAREAQAWIVAHEAQNPQGQLL
jgi:hypothetical protein